MENTKVLGRAIAINTGGIYSSELKSGIHTMMVDEPAEFGGENLGPSPIDLLCMSLASCKAITLRMYSKRKDWNMTHVQVEVSFVRATQIASGRNTFYCTLKLQGELDEAQQTRLLEISKACPVDRLLRKESDVFTFVE